MVLEITSYGSDTDRRDRVAKPRSYALAGIPVYLLVDRDDCSVTAFSQPEGDHYRTTTKRPYGAVVDVPEPVGIPLETAGLKAYAR